MAVLMSLVPGLDFDVMCSNCEVKFYLIFERKGGVAILSYCPFCGEELREKS